MIFRPGISKLSVKLWPVLVVSRLENGLVKAGKAGLSFRPIHPQDFFRAFCRRMTVEIKMNQISSVLFVSDNLPFAPAGMFPKPSASSIFW